MAAVFSPPRWTGRFALASGPAWSSHKGWSHPGLGAAPCRHVSSTDEPSRAFFAWLGTAMIPSPRQSPRRQRRDRRDPRRRGKPPAWPRSRQRARREGVQGTAPEPCPPRSCRPRRRTTSRATRRPVWRSSAPGPASPARWKPHPPPRPHVFAGGCGRADLSRKA